MGTGSAIFGAFMLWAAATSDGQSYRLGNAKETTLARTFSTSLTFD
jgi:hypothetical protein